MEHNERLMQWELSVEVWHSPEFGHELTATIYQPGRKAHEAGDWRWRGLGVDPELIEDIVGRLEAVVVEHLVTRYGLTTVNGTRWAGEPEPF